MTPYGASDYDLTVSKGNKMAKTLIAGPYTVIYCTVHVYLRLIAD